MCPEWNGGRRAGAGGLLTDDARHNIEVRAKNAAKVMPPPGGGTASLVQAMQPNVEKIRSLDNALLRGTDASVKGLVHFKAESCVGVLATGEERFTIATDGLDEEISLGRPYRSCIRVLETNTSRLEIFWTESRPSIWSWLDLGGIGWPTKQILYYRWNIRGGECFDSPHRLVRIRANATNKNSLQFVTMEWAIVFQFLHGPFASEANYQMFKDAADELFKNFDFTYQLYREFYGWIVEDVYEGIIPPGFGSEEHMQAMWNTLPTRPIFKKMGELQKGNRWNSWDIKFRGMRKDTSVMGLVICHIEVVRGVVTDLQSVLFFGGSDPTEADEMTDVQYVAPDGPCGSAAPPVPVKASNHDVASLRRQTKGNAHLSLSVLTNRTSRRLAHVLHYAGEPLEYESRMGRTLLTTQTGCFDWIVNISCGGYSKMINDIWAVMRDRKMLRNMGFLVQDVMGSGSVLEDELIATTLVDFSRDLVAGIIQAFATLSHRPPFGLLGVLSRDPVDVQNKLGWARDLWHMLERFEKREVVVAGGAEKFREALWPSSPICREWLIGLFEVNFEGVPPDLVAEMTDVARVSHTSVPVEQMNSKLTDEMRQSKGGFLGRTSKMHRMMQSGIYTENDRVPPTPTMEDKVSSRAVNLGSSMFKAEEVCSLGEQCLEDILDRKPGVEALGNAVYFDAPVVTANLIAAEHIDVLETSWLSLLAFPGTLIGKESAGIRHMSYVVATSANAVTTCSISPKQVDGQKYFDFGAAGKEVWSYTCLTSLEDIVVLETKALPPSLVKATDPVDGLPLGVVVGILEQKPIAILKHAIANGLRGTSKPYLRKLIRFLEITVVGRMPTLEIDLVKLLILEVFPDATPEEVAEMLARRHMKVKAKYDTVLNEDIIEGNSNILDDCMITESKASLKDYCKKLEGMKAAAAAANAKAGLKVPALKASKKKKVFAAKDMTGIDEVRARLPPGATIALETEWHCRFKVTIACLPTPPFSKSAPFTVGNAASRAKAIGAVIKWAWLRYSEIDGAEPCPFDLDACEF